MSELMVLIIGAIIVGAGTGFCIAISVIAKANEEAYKDGYVQGYTDARSEGE